MTIEDEPLLKTFRAPGPCEACGKNCPQGRDPHHIRHKGLGGGSRLDIPENVLSVCRECHIGIHSTAWEEQGLWYLVGKRLGKTWEECRQTVWDKLREPK